MGMGRDQRHRVVVIGGGFAGLNAVRGLREAPVEVTLVDRQNFHLFQPLAYQVATGALSSAEVAAPLRAVLKRQANARVVLASVTGFDLGRREVVLGDLPDGEAERRLPYDTLVVAGGSNYSYFGHEEWREFAPELKSIGGALDIRGRLLTAFEAAELEPDPERRRAWLTFAVVGAGPTGVEMAGQIAELARDTLRGDFRATDARARADRAAGRRRARPARVPEGALRATPRAQLEGSASSRCSDGWWSTSTPSRSPGRSAGGACGCPARTVVWAAGVTASRAGGAARRGGRGGGRQSGPGRGRARPDPRGPPRGARRSATWSASAAPTGSRWAAGAGAGRDPAGPLRGEGDRRPPARRAAAPVPLPRQGRPGDDRPLEGGRRTARASTSGACPPGSPG